MSRAIKIKRAGGEGLLYTETLTVYNILEEKAST
jgi:hypothetical protein